jgi:hypothetical protein
MKDTSFSTTGLVFKLMSHMMAVRSGEGRGEGQKARL